MARDAALVTTFGSPVRGREAKSLEVFTEFLTFLGKQAAEGRCSQPEPFFAASTGTSRARRSIAGCGSSRRPGANSATCRLRTPRPRRCWASLAPGTGVARALVKKGRGCGAARNAP